MLHHCSLISCVHSSHTYQTHFYYFYIFCFVLYFLIIPQPKQGYISNFLLFMILSSRCSLSKFQFYVLFLLWNSSLRHWVFCSELFLVFHFYFLVLVSIWIQCLHPTSVFHFFFLEARFCHSVAVVVYQWIPCTIHRTDKSFFSTKLSLKIGPTTLFIHLKIILL